MNKLVPDSVFPVQREAFTNVIKSRGNWYDLIMRIFSLNPKMRTKFLKALIVDGNLLAWPQQEKNREKYQCNIPWPSCSTLQVLAICIARAAGRRVWL